MSGAHNLAVLGDESFARHGDYASLFFEGEWQRTGALHERAARIARGLAELGVEAGDRVVVSMENAPDVGPLYGGIWRAGAVVTPAIFLLPPEELKRIVDDSEARVVVTSEIFREKTEAAAGGRPVVTTEELAAADRGDDIVPRDDDDLAALIYTGGTTGRAKGVMLSHANLWHAGRMGHDHGYVAGVTRSLTSLPLSHAYGLLLMAVGMHAREPGVNVLMRWFEPNMWLELAAAQRVQIAAVVPSMLQMILACPLEEHDLSELRYVISGAAPLPAEVAAELTARLPSVEIREGYGLSESSAIVSGNRPGRSRLGSVGEPVAETEVRIAAETGEILVRSPTVMQGYWRAPDLTAETVRDGWLHTGDVGRLDDDGYLYVVDRLKDLIIRGGFNVFPRDVEEALLEHPAVMSAAVVGRNDAVHGEEVVAFVTARGVAGPELVAWARERIGGYKYPREIHVVDDLPLTPIGKIDRKALRAAVGPTLE